MDVVWSDLAFESVTDIISYVHTFFGQRTAQRIANGIFSFVNKLGFQPYLGRHYLNLADGSEVRCVLYKANRIYYQIADGEIRIIIVWDGRQNPDKLRSLLNAYLLKSGDMQQ